jgi:prolyl oligopeptidase
MSKFVYSYHISMKNLYTFSLCATLALAGCQSKQSQLMQQPLTYPTTKTVTQEDDYFGVKVQDSYRWLEDGKSDEVAAWVTSQNTLTFDYLKKIPFRDSIKSRLEKIWNYERYSAPFKMGNRYFFYKNNGLQNQSILYVQDKLEATPQVLLDPNTLSNDGTVALSTVAVSKDGKYLAYMIARAGSDWNEAYVMEIETKKILEDKLEWLKYSGISWYKNGFFYSRYEKPEQGAELQAMNFNHKVYYHQIGKPQSEDELVYEDKEHKERGFGTMVTDDERFLILSGWEGTSGNTLLAKDLTKEKNPFVKLVDDLKNDHDVIDNEGEELLILTNRNAPNKRLTKVKLSTPDNWLDIIPENPKTALEKVSKAGTKLFAFYLEDAKTKILQYNYNGKLEKEVQLPNMGTAAGLDGGKEDKEAFYTFTSYTTPITIYHYDITTGKSTVFRQTQAGINPENYEMKQVFYPSKDGTKVPMFIVHKKGLNLDGKNPTYLYAYGGFNVNILPAFSIKYVYWLENNGVLAIPNLRGGGEYGEAWHKGGMLENKQNVFDDFIAAAEYLINNQYTSKERLAIAGGSNGGLLVGATMTQRPDLCKVALPAVGVLDMLRFHRFTIGRAWITEYGCADSSKVQFENLYKYSPLHNIKPDTEYPATMVITADHDDRVVPLHSFKFISALQANQKGTNPVLIRIETKAGHGAGKPTSKIIEEWADVVAFMWWQMGYNPLEK